MLFKHFWLWTLSVTFAICGCAGKSFGMFDSPDKILINRFDIALFQWIDTDDPAVLQTLINDHPQMLATLDNALFQTIHDDSAAFFLRMKNYYADPSLQSLYKDAITVFNVNSLETKQIENELSYGFTQLKSIFPNLQIPAIYMHVSGLQQNIIVADSLLSFSVDKYLGADYPLYKDFFYDYQLKSMTPESVAKDGFYAWLASEYPYQGKANDLLDKMIYEGKIIYVLTQAGYNYSPLQIMSLTENEYKWCLKNESAVWKTILQRNHLESSEAAIVSRYFQPAPSVFFSEDAPGNLGKFIGYCIVARYMKQIKANCQNLMMNNDARDIFKKSKYKP